jgi:hypothetical protein
MRLNRLDTLGISHYTGLYRVVQEFVARNDGVFKLY